MADLGPFTTCGDQLPCPWCGHIMKDLWDYNWRDTEGVVITECGECLKPVDIHRKVSTHYEIHKGAPAEPKSVAEDK